MKPARFAYHPARSAEETVELLAQWASAEGRIIAGGQSLVPAMALRLALPAHLIDINGVPEFGHIEVGQDEIAIGACVRHAAFEQPVADGPLGTALAAVVRHIAHHPIRTRGTFCGSLANADPASEWCLVAATLGATLVARSTRGTRVVPAEEFFEGMLATALAPDEVLTAAHLPMLAPDARWGFHEVNRRAGDFAIAMAFAVFRVVDGLIVGPRVGVGGVESHPRRIAEAEAALAGKAPQAAMFATAAAIAADAVEPIDERADIVTYKRDVTRAAVQRALEAAERMA